MAPEELLKFIAVIVKEIVATDSATVRRTMSSASQHVEIAKELHARIALMMESLEKTQTLINEAIDITKLVLKKYTSYKNNLYQLIIIIKSEYGLFINFRSGLKLAMYQDTR